MFQKVLSGLYSFVTEKRNLSYIRTFQLFLLLITICVSSLILFIPDYKKFQTRIELGKTWLPGRSAPMEVISNVNIEFLMLKEYQEAQSEAERLSPLYFIRLFEVLDKKEAFNKKNKRTEETSIVYFHSMLAEDLQNFKFCKSLSQKNSEIITCANSKIKNWKNLNLEHWHALLLFSSGNLEKRLSHLVGAIFQKYIIIKKEIHDPIFKNFKGNIVRVQNTKYDNIKEEMDVPFKNVIQSKQLYYDPLLLHELEEYAQIILKDLKLSPFQIKTLLKLARGYFHHIDGNYFDKEKTKEAQKLTRENINPSAYLYKVKKGEVIVHADEIISESMYKALKIYQNNQKQEFFKGLAFLFIQQSIFLFFILYFILRLSDKRINDVNTSLILFSIIWLFLLCLFFTENLWRNDFKNNVASYSFGTWLPMGSFGVLLSLIVGETLGLPILLYMSYLAFIASSYDGLTLFTTTTLSISSLLLGSRIKKRVHFISVSILITCILLLLVSLNYIYSNKPILDFYSKDIFFTKNFLSNLKISFLSGISTLAVLGILPLFETIFNIPTRFKLIELADTAHPLLKNMFQKAPSTWLHTLMVAALTEKACEKLGLNAILARTGIYFHDIGKMVNAGFFVENQHLIPKPEYIDEKNPNQAAKVIIDHVTDGIKMAREARLPQEVIAFIPEHHGTSIMSFFYHRALQKNRRRVQKEWFQYKGPKPQSKETAIAMIADSVEAASRSLDEYTKDSLNTLVLRIIQGKMSENQFDECDITIKELNIIRESFVDVLISSFHLRPKYPNQKETTMLESHRKKLKK